MSWRDELARSVVNDGDDAPRPSWDAGSPWCAHDDCPLYDGKRCRATGTRPGNICEPVVQAMAERLDSTDRLVEQLRGICRRIIDTSWPRYDQSMGPSHYLCSACGIRCPDGDECLLPDLRRLGVLP